MCYAAEDIDEAQFVDNMWILANAMYNPLSFNIFLSTA